MSEYKIQFFNSELPKRLKYLLKEYYPKEKEKGQGYEVTFLISIASCLFSNTKEQIENEFVNSDISERNLTTTNEFLDKEIKSVKDDLFQNIYKWEHKKTNFIRKEITVEYLKEKKYNDLLKSTKKVKGVIKCIRNGLAHNGICFGSEEGRINDIFLFSKADPVGDIKNNIDYNILKIPVESFYTFCINWINYLNKNNLHIAVINKALDHDEQRADERA